MVRVVMTLLEKAQSVPTGKGGQQPRDLPEDELQDLAIAYLEGAITGSQFSAVLGVRASGAAPNAIPILKRAFRSGRLRSQTV